MKPVLMLHGWGSAGSSFNDLIARLGDDFDCRAPDLPGHGLSADLPATLDQCGDFAVEALEAFERDDVLVIGWSMGAAVAWDMISKRGTDKIAGLVTIDMSPKIKNRADWLHGIQGQPETGPVSGAEITHDWHNMAEFIVKNMMFATDQGSPGYALETAVADTRACDPALMAPLWDDMVAADQRDVMAKVECPAIVARGNKSAFFAPAMSDWLVDAMPKAELLEFTEAGHSPHLEEPEKFAKAIRDFSVRA